jgi:GT2 family glycosyltransferase
MATVGIIVINLNQKKYVQGFIDELAKQSFRDFRLYIVDNGSSSAEKLQPNDITHPWIEQIDMGANVGFADGNNAGMQKAVKDGCRYLWIVNNDIYLREDTLQKFVEYLSQHADIGAVGGKIYYAGDQNRIWYAGGKIDWGRPYTYSVCRHYGEGEIDQGRFEETSDTDFVTGASMFVPVEVWEKTGGFDSRYFAYFEDADWSLRIKKAGYRVVYYPRAVMWHMVGALSGVTSVRSSYYQVRNSLLFIRLWGTPAAKFFATINSFITAVKSCLKILIPGKMKFGQIQLGALVDYYMGSFGGPKRGL